MSFQVHHSDCLSFMRGLPDNHVDAIVTDPPYGLSFMGKKWDYDVPSEEIWRECLRVLKPGVICSPLQVHERSTVWPCVSRTRVLRYET